MGKGSKKKAGKPTMAKAPWDHGTGTLAAVCGSDDAVSEFRGFLRDNPPVVRGGLEGDALERAREKALAARAREFATMNGLVREDATFRDEDTGKQVNPNGVKRRRRQSLIERYMQRQLITGAQYLSARDLQAAYKAEAMSDEGVVVDFTRDPEDAVVSLIDRQAAYRRMRAAIPKEVWPIVENVVIHERSISCGSKQGRKVTLAMAQLRLGLDRLSAHLRR